MKLPENYIEELRQLTGETDVTKIACARKIGMFWDEFGEAITMSMADDEGWDEPNYKKAHTWFIESTAGSVKSNVNEIYTHARIYKNVLKPKRDKKHDAFTYGQWESLLRNIKKSKGIVDEDIFNERIEWMYTEADKHYGEFPSTRNINAEYKKNGHHSQEAIHWKKIVYQAKEIEKIGQYEDARIMMLVIEIIRLDKEMKEE